MVAPLIQGGYTNFLLASMKMVARKLDFDEASNPPTLQD
jgi:hypothetical protein